MNIEFEHNGTEYIGSGDWDAEKGFTARLIGYLPSSASFMSNKLEPLPAQLPITIDRSKRGLLINPRYTKGGATHFSQNNPLTLSINVAASAFITELPWETPADIEITSLSVKCNALDMWYGDNIGKVEQDFSEYVATAHFKLETDIHETHLGSLKIDSNVTLPGFPRMGTYIFKTGATAGLLLKESATLEGAISLAKKIEGYFDLLTGFPSRSIAAKFTLAGVETPITASIAIYSHSEPSSDHPHRIFFRRGEHQIEPSFSTYVKAFDDISFLQNTLRMLSKSTMMVPEGFLSACNVIESLGKDAPNSNEGISEKIATISRALDSVEDKSAYAAFEAIKNKLPKHASFKDKFSLVSSFMSQFGFSVSLPQDTVSKVRGKYRHDILAVKPADVVVMQATVGFAWLLGLIWLCKQIGLTKDEIKTRCASELFHLQRNTGLGHWGKLEKEN